MIIKCPNCRKPISSKAALCSHCGHELGEVSEEQLQEFERRRLRDRIYRLRMASYTAIAVLLVAVGWYWWESRDFSSPPGMGPAILVAVGTVAYLVVRGLLFTTRREMKKLR
jgi:uncharacterized membrane protein YvbJ